MKNHDDIDYDHPLLNEQDVIELDGVTFTKTSTDSFQSRYRAFSSMQDFFFETVFRHLEGGGVHRTTTVFDDRGLIVNRVSKELDVSLDSFDRKNIKSLVNNYMMEEAHLEAR